MTPRFRSKVVYFVALIASVHLILCSWLLLDQNSNESIPTGPDAQTEQQLLPTGPDGRTEMPLPNINEDPYTSIVRITLFKKDGSIPHCTGFAIAPTVVATAAHCLTEDIDEAGITWGVSAYDFVSADQFAKSNEEDYGVIFTDAPIPSSTWFELGKFPEPTSSTTMRTAGFPGDKPDGFLWEATYEGFVVNPKNPNQVLSGGHSGGGQSGSPLFDEAGVATGILVANSCGEVCPEETTYFVQFNEKILNELEGWI